VAQTIARLKHYVSSEAVLFGPRCACRGEFVFGKEFFDKNFRMNGKELGDGLLTSPGKFFSDLTGRRSAGNGSIHCLPNGGFFDA
jgi:hypothetical protein